MEFPPIRLNKGGNVPVLRLMKDLRNANHPSYHSGFFSYSFVGLIYTERYKPFKDVRKTENLLVSLTRFLSNEKSKLQNSIIYMEKATYRVSQHKMSKIPVKKQTIKLMKLS